MNEKVTPEGVTIRTVEYNVVCPNCRKSAKRTDWIMRRMKNAVLIWTIVCKNCGYDDEGVKTDISVPD